MPGTFKQVADQAGIEFTVAVWTRNAASLHGHFLNAASADWDLRGNIAKRKWDIVVLQEQSDATLPAGRGANANHPQFAAQADKIERFIHVGTEERYRERGMHTAICGSVANCVAAGGTQSRCDNNAQRTIPANLNANPAAQVFLLQTWARPDMVYPHRATVADANHPTVPDGRPILDTLGGTFADGYPDTLYYAAEGLAAMTADLRSAFATKAQSNPAFAGVIPVGEAFQRAVDQSVARGDGFYGRDGTYAFAVPQDRINLWWDDYLHASRYGSYFSVLVMFGQLTGIDPWSLGASEEAAADLGISAGDAVKLQRIAS